MLKVVEMTCVSEVNYKLIEESSNHLNIFEKGKSNAMVDVRACNKPVEKVSVLYEKIDAVL